MTRGKELKVGDCVVTHSGTFKITKIEPGDQSPFGKRMPGSFWHKNPITLWFGKDYAVIAPSDDFTLL